MLTFFCDRVMLTIGCPMKFHNYPMDTQTCRLALQSFGYDLNHNFYQWLRPPRIRRDINLDNHEIKMTHFNFTYSSEGKENIFQARTELVLTTLQSMMNVKLSKQRF